MFRKTMAVLGTAVVVGLLGLYAVGAVFAESPAPTPNATQPNAEAAPKQGAWGRVCRGAGVVSDAVAKALGMTREEVMTERAAGKTLSQIAKEKNLTDQQVIDAIVAEQKAAIDQALKDSKITQAQADWLLAQAKAMAPFQVSNPFTPKMHAQKDGANGEQHGMRFGRGRGSGETGKAAPTASPATPQS